MSNITVSAVEATAEKPQLGIMITAEAALYAAILSLAAVLRLWNLPASPLSAHEAAQAMAAFTGSAMPTGGSPLLFNLNQVLFGLFGLTVNDSGVRLGAALIGTGMVLLPVLFRAVIGRYGTLAAALMLALSPTMVLASRSLDGSIVIAACALAAVGFGLRYFTAQKRLDLIGLAISIGLALTSGPGLITVGLVLIPALFIVYRWLIDDDGRARLRQLRRESHTLRDAMLIGGAAFILASTGLLLRPMGVSGAPEILSAWLKAWTGDDAIGGLRLFQVLIVYEPLILFFGLAGLLISLRRMTALTVLLSIWTIGSLIVAILQAGRQVLDLTLVLTPLALLGGIALELLGRDLEQHGAWRVEGWFWLVAAIILGFLAINTSRSAMGANSASGTLLGITLGQFTSIAVGAVLAATVIVGLFLILIGWQATLRAGAMTLFVMLAVVSFSSAWSVTQVRPNDPRELVWGPTATSLEVRALREELEAASKQRSGFINQAAVVVTLPQDNPILRWYLRDFAKAQYNAVVSDLAPILVAPADSTFPPFVTDTYQGQRFKVQTQWEPSQLTNNDSLRWWLYRESDAAPAPTQTYVVWVKTNKGD